MTDAETLAAIKAECVGIITDNANESWHNGNCGTCGEMWQAGYILREHFGWTDEQVDELTGEADAEARAQRERDADPTPRAVVYERQTIDGITYTTIKDSQEMP